MPSEQAIAPINELLRDDRRHDIGIDPFGRFLKLSDVMQSIGVSQAMVYKLMQDEVMPFPRPVKIGRSSLWVERDVVAWKTAIVGNSQ